MGDDKSSHRKKKRLTMYTSASRASIVGKKSSFSGLNRRSSMFETRSGENKLDPRPLNNKEYHLHCCEVLSTYLDNRGYTQTVSIKSLMNPTSKEFSGIIIFLFCQLDPMYEI